MVVLARRRGGHVGAPLLLLLLLCVLRSLSGEVSTQGGVSALAAEVLEAANGGGDPPVGGAAEHLRAVTAELAQLRQEAAAQEVEQRDLLAAADREAVEGAASAQVQSAAYRRVRSQLDATKRRLAAASTRYKRMVESLGEEEDRVAAAKRVGGDVQRIKQRLAAFKEAQRRDDDVKAAEL